MTSTQTLPTDPAWDALVTVNQLQDLLPTELYEGSKDWTQLNLVGRVEWLLAMYESVKAERDELLNQIIANEPEEFDK